MSVVIFANGELETGEWVRSIVEGATALIAADGGTRHVRKLGLWPDVVIGDLDSMEPDLKQELQEANIKVLTYPEAKDETDLELALRYAAATYDEEIILIGALGGRLDQLLANVFLLTAPFLEGRAVKIVEAFQAAWILREGSNLIEGKAGDLVSLLPMNGDVQIGRTSGLEWPILDETLVQGLSRGISNRLTTDAASVTLNKGTVLCIHLAGEWDR